MAWFITLGWTQLSVTFRAFLIENQSSIEKLDENEAESQRIDIILLLYSRLLSHTFCSGCSYLYWFIPFQPLFFFLGIFLRQNCLGTMDCWVELQLTVGTKLSKCDPSPCALISNEKGRECYWLLHTHQFDKPCHLQVERSHVGQFVFSVSILLINPSSFTTEKT